MPDPGSFVGIDVSKRHLDVALLPDPTTFRVTNDADGWADLIARIAADPEPCLVLEATGSYHVGVTLALAEAGLPPAVVNPAQTHASFAAKASAPRPTARTPACWLVSGSRSSPPRVRS